MVSFVVGYAHRVQLQHVGVGVGRADNLAGVVGGSGDAALVGILA